MLFKELKNVFQQITIILVKGIKIFSSLLLQILIKKVKLGGKMVALLLNKNRN